mgnify:CR=1 FL=1
MNDSSQSLKTCQPEPSAMVASTSGEVVDSGQTNTLDNVLDGMDLNPSHHGKLPSPNEAMSAYTEPTLVSTAGSSRPPSSGENATMSQATYEALTLEVQMWIESKFAACQESLFKLDSTLPSDPTSTRQWVMQNFVEESHALPNPIYQTLEYNRRICLEALEDLFCIFQNYGLARGHDFVQKDPCDVERRVWLILSCTLELSRAYTLNIKTGYGQTCKGTHWYSEEDEGLLKLIAEGKGNSLIESSSNSSSEQDEADERDLDESNPKNSSSKKMSINHISLIFGNEEKSDIVIRDSVFKNHCPWRSPDSLFPEKNRPTIAKSWKYFCMIYNLDEVGKSVHCDFKSVLLPVAFTLRYDPTQKFSARPSCGCYEVIQVDAPAELGQMKTMPEWSSRTIYHSDSPPRSPPVAPAAGNLNLGPNIAALQDAITQINQPAAKIKVHIPVPVASKAIPSPTSNAAYLKTEYLGSGVIRLRSPHFPALLLENVQYLTVTGTSGTGDLFMVKSNLKKCMDEAFRKYRIDDELRRKIHGKVDNKKKNKRRAREGDLYFKGPTNQLFLHDREQDLYMDPNHLKDVEEALKVDSHGVYTLIKLNVGDKLPLGDASISWVSVDGHVPSRKVICDIQAAQVAAAAAGSPRRAKRNYSKSVKPQRPYEGHYSGYESGSQFPHGITPPRYPIPSMQPNFPPSYNPFKLHQEAPPRTSHSSSLRLPPTLSATSSSSFFGRLDYLGPGSGSHNQSSTLSSLLSQRGASAPSTLQTESPMVTTLPNFSQFSIPTSSTSTSSKMRSQDHGYSHPIHFSSDGLKFHPSGTKRKATSESDDSTEEEKRRRRF